MKKLLVVLAVFTGAAQAAPFLYGDVVATEGVTHCGMVLDSAPKVTANVVAGTPPQCKFDLSTIKPGSHTATLTAIVIDPVWGTQESPPSAPFTFVRPATPSVPSATRLAP